MAELSGFQHLSVASWTNPQSLQSSGFLYQKWTVWMERHGLCNIQATFQRLRDRVLVYLDDIIVLGWDAPEMMQWRGQVFDRLHHSNLKLKPSKGCFPQCQVVYLGHIVWEEGISLASHYDSLA